MLSRECHEAIIEPGKKPYCFDRLSPEQPHRNRGGKGFVAKKGLKKPNDLGALQEKEEPLGDLRRKKLKNEIILKMSIGKKAALPLRTSSAWDSQRPEITVKVKKTALTNEGNFNIAVGKADSWGAK